MANKPKTTQPQTEGVVQGRDLFQTPRYATELLIPFIPKYIGNVWECASGEGKISDVLWEHNYDVLSTDLNMGSEFNFLTNTPFGVSRWQTLEEGYCIITNPPFSLKYKFIMRAIEYGVPFAFLIPFDMCKQMAELFSVYGCQGVVPNRRIDYITPTGKSGATGHSSYYHSFWITRYFDLGNQLVFVDLTKEMKQNI